MFDLTQLFTVTQVSSSLLISYQNLISAEPKLRRREISERLGVPEAGLIDHQCGVKRIRLKPAFSDIIRSLPKLGYIMTLTRNDTAVHERKGVYENVSVTGPMGLAIADDRKIDLRMILSRWAFGFAVEEKISGGVRHSLQFFDRSGQAIQKIFLQKDSDTKAYGDLVTLFKSSDEGELVFSSGEDTPVYAADTEVDVSALAQQWQSMTDVHQFFGMLRQHNVSREQAFRLVGSPYAEPLQKDILEPMLQQAAQKQIPLMCFVGNQGNIQIHSGTVVNIKRMGPWVNVLDPEFNLHVMESGVTSAWLVRKPTADGEVTSLEFYDKQGETVAQFFGVREEGNPENTAWRALAESFLPLGATE